MKKKIIVCLLNILILSCMMGNSIYAASSETLDELPELISGTHKEEYSQDELIQIMEIFSMWTDEELNEYIAYIASDSCSEIISGTSVPTGDGQTAWLAAAAIVKSEYPCVAALIESSVLGITYMEGVSISDGDNSGLFQVKIKTTSEYSDYIQQLNTGTAANGKAMTFEADENADLAYSLHNCNAYYSITGTGNLTTYNWYIYDLYDFTWDTEYNSPIISMVNNAAYLYQQLGALNAIDVYIYFYPVGVI